MAATKVSFFCQKSLSGTLTCAQVLDLMMNQPTSDEKSHAHLHMSDGFRIDPANIVVNVRGLPIDDLERKKQIDALKLQKQKEWGTYDSHLFPGAANPLSQFAPASYAQLPQQTRKSMVMQDATRIAQSNQYNERTGLGEIPAIPERFGVRYFVKKLPPGRGRGRPTDVDIANVAAATGLNVDEYVSANGTIKVFQGQGPQIAALVPKVPAKSTHSMFEDSESMVMHLTAALLSKAGLSVLQTLKTNGHNGGKTVGVFSKTAVLAVSRHFQSVADRRGGGFAAAQIVDRKADTDPQNPRQLTGTFSKSTQNIDHVVVVLACSQENDLVVVTCYPSAASTHATIGTVTMDGQDIAEHDFGKHTVMQRQHTLPTLSW